MNYELISAKDYDNLPEEPDLKFVEIDRICRLNLTEMVEDSTNDYFNNMVYLQYMTTLAAAAAELNIPNVQFPQDEDHPTNHIHSFMLAVSGEVTRIRLRASSRSAPYSVRLGVRTKAQIQIKVQQLRRIIEQAEMSERKRKVLLGRLDDLIDEINGTSLSFARTMKILATVSVGVCMGASFLADAPQAIATITQLIGVDKEREEAEAKRLGIKPQPKLLPPPETATTTASATPIYDDLDDEIPF
jgi:hypothetical protein